MPLPLPQLDDYTYDELLEMARSLIPAECPEWTDHNPSDTGIILLELFAWLTELLLYRTDQVPEASQMAFLQLLNGANYQPTAATLPHDRQATVLDLRDRYRAVTVADYEYLALQVWPNTKPAQALQEPIQRVKAFANTEIAANDAPGHMSLVVLPAMAPLTRAAGATASPPPLPVPSPALRRSLWQFFNPRRLLTTHHHIVGPSYRTVSIRATLHLQPDQEKAAVAQQALNQLWQFFHPLIGGERSQGWPFGRDVYLSEVYQQLDEVPGVDYVTAVSLHGADDPQPEAPPHRLSLAAHQLIRLDLAHTQLTAQHPWEHDDD